MKARFEWSNQIEFTSFERGRVTTCSSTVSFSASSFNRDPVGERGRGLVSAIGSGMPPAPQVNERTNSREKSCRNDANRLALCQSRSSAYPPGRISHFAFGIKYAQWVRL